MNYIDSHQHFWDISRGDYHWLNNSLGVIYKDFQPSDLLPLIKQSNVGKTILVQAADSLNETKYLLEIAEKNHFVVGVVGWVDFEAKDSVKTIELLAKNPYFKGVRPMLQDIEDTHWILNPAFSAVFNALIKCNLSFDALIQPRHLPSLLTLLERHPNLKVVIDHAAKPDIANDHFQPWAREIENLASKTSVLCKLSGLKNEANGANIAPYMQHLLNTFTPHRLMWGSDWPVLNLVGDYESWIKEVENFLSIQQPELSHHEKNLIMKANAAKFYNIKMDD